MTLDELKSLENNTDEYVFVKIRDVWFDVDISKKQETSFGSDDIAFCIHFTQYDFTSDLDISGYDKDFVEFSIRLKEDDSVSFVDIDCQKSFKKFITLNEMKIVNYLPNWKTVEPSLVVGYIFEHNEFFEKTYGQLAMVEKKEYLDKNSSVDYILVYGSNIKQTRMYFQQNNLLKYLIEENDKVVDELNSKVSNINKEITKIHNINRNYYTMLGEE